MLDISYLLVIIRKTQLIGTNMKYHQHTVYIRKDSTGLTAHRNAGDSEWGEIESRSEKLDVVWVCCNEVGKEIHKIYGNCMDAESYARSCNRFRGDDSENVIVECLGIL
jgi:hypothetical protein